MLVMLVVCLAMTGCGDRSGIGERDSGSGEERVTERPLRPAEPKKQSPAADWPLFRGDTAGSGVARSGLPETLELLWKFEPEGAAFYSTAAIVGETVYVGDAQGKFFALDLATGQPRWSVEAPLGFVAAPAVVEGRVFVGDGDGMFHCYDAANGEERWQFETGDEISSGANFYEDSLLFGGQDGNLTRLNRADGKKVWQFNIEAEGGIQCMPTLGENRAFFAGCDGQLHVVDVNNGESIATVDVGDPTLSSPAVRGDIAYFGTEGGNVFAVDWRKAETVWTFRGERNQQPYRSSPAVDAELVVIGGRDKMVRGLDPASGEQKWAFPTKARVDSSPVIVGDRVFVGSSDGRIYGLNKQTGEQLWQYDAGGSFIASPAVGQGRLVIGSDDGVLYCFGKSDPALDK